MEFESNASIIYTPINTMHTAENLAELALKKGLAICVNIIRQAVAMYMWEGEIKKTQECLLICYCSAYQKVGRMGFPLAREVIASAMLIFCFRKVER